MPSDVTPSEPMPVAAQTFADAWLRGRRAVMVLVGMALVIFAVRFSYFVLQDLAEGYAHNLAARLFNESTGALLTMPTFGALLWLTVRCPLVRPLRRGTTAAYLAAFGAITFVHTTAMIVVRAALAPSLGLTGYTLAFSLSRYGYEAVNSLFPAVAILALVALAESVYADRARERRATELTEGLLRAQLSNLRLQLQPHFLFNALNTISETMHEDVEVADALLVQLAGLLRASLRSTHAHEVPVHEEQQLLEQYLGLLHARFGERLQARVVTGAGMADLLVPSMLLQPLVENAIHHGGVTRVGRGCVTVTIAREPAPWGEALAIRVHDDGPSLDLHAGTSPQSGGGTGLRATRQRLRLLYGDAHEMRAGPAPEGGFGVVLRIPARTRAEAVASRGRVTAAHAGARAANASRIRSG